MLEGKDYLSLNKLFLFVAAFIDWCMECEMTAPVTRVDARYSEIVADGTGDTRRWA